MKFIYRAKDKQGNVRAGKVEARSLDTAVSILQGYDLIVLEISPEKKITILDGIFGRKMRISKKDLAIFLRQFSTLLESQVPLGEALRTLYLQAATPAIKDLVFGLVSDLDAGLPLSKSMEKKTDIFGEFYIQMIKSGEISGRLEEVLTYLADYAEHENDLINKAKSAATYPAFLFGTFILISVVITVALAPQMVSIFEEFGAVPPLGTKILIFIGGFFKNWGILALVFLLGMIWLFTNYFRSVEGRRIGGIYILRIPVIGEVYKKIFISRFCETAGTLIHGGIPVVTAFEVAGESTGNYIYQKIGYKVADAVKKGESISSILKKDYEYLPPLVSQMVAVGESTGRLDSILRKVSGYFQKEVDRSFGTMIDLLQPILVVVIGILVAFLVSAVLLPIYQLAQNV
ncbi:MAG TPA: type II secretion system F family protein [Candidatus Paceibacterota bacterium]|nr:type II secretion system F family protein [Candidatus Paceibacterota bacterium]